MKLVNKSEKFVLMYCGKEYTVPKGEFEVINFDLANHIRKVAKKWEKDVAEVPSAPIAEIKQAEEIKATEPVKPKPKATFGGATSETIPKKQVMGK